MDKKLQALDHKSQVRSWDLCHHIHHELGQSSRYSFWPKYTNAIKQEGYPSLEMGQ